MMKGLGADIDAAIDAKNAKDAARQRTRDRFELIKAAIIGFTSQWQEFKTSTRIAEEAIYLADTVLEQLDTEEFERESEGKL